VGTPVGAFRRPNRPALVNSYDGWRGAQGRQRLQPVHRSLSFNRPGSSPRRSATSTPAPTQYFGNMTRYNPKFRQLANLTENFSIAKSFHITEKTRLDFRAEAFNLFNRTAVRHRLACRFRTHNSASSPRAVTC
jgi:hypothetical protein